MMKWERSTHKSAQTLLFACAVFVVYLAIACQSEPDPSPIAEPPVVAATVANPTVIFAPNESPPRIVTLPPEVKDRLAPTDSETTATSVSNTELELGSIAEPTVTISEDVGVSIDEHDEPPTSDIAVLRVPFNGGLVPDPAFDDGVGANRSLLAELFSGLTRLSPLDGVAEPDLAESFTVDPDGMGYEFVLRKELKFSDGSPVTTADFIWSWERALDPDYGNRNARRVFDGISAFTVIDDLTLRINLEKPNYDLPHLLADPVASVLKRTNVENWVMDWRYVLSGAYIDADRELGDQLPLGTGPFRLVEYDLFDHVLVLERNPHHWDMPAQVDRVEFISPDAYLGAESSASATVLFDNYVIDMLPIPPDFARVQGEWEVRAFDIAPTIDFLAFNSDLDPYRDPDFRRALIAVSPVDELLPEGGLSTNGSEVLIASSLLPPDFPGHVDEPFVAGDDYSDTEFGANGIAPTLTFHTYVGGYAIEEFQILADQWAEHLGVEVDVRTVSLDEFDAWLKNGDVEIRRVSVTPHYADPSAILTVMDGLFGERDRSPEAEEISRRLADATQQPDAATRLALFHDLEHYLIGNALVLPLFWTENRQWVRTQSWVVDYAPPKYHGSRFKTVRIDVKHPDYPYDER